MTEEELKKLAEKFGYKMSKISIDEKDKEKIKEVIEQKDKDVVDENKNVIKNLENKISENNLLKEKELEKKVKELEEKINSSSKVSGEKIESLVEIMEKVFKFQEETLNNTKDKEKDQAVIDEIKNGSLR